MCSIHGRVACTRLIDNKGFNSLKGFGVMDGGTGVLDMDKRLDSREVVTIMKLGMV